MHELLPKPGIFQRHKRVFSLQVNFSAKHGFQNPRLPTEVILHLFTDLENLGEAVNRKRPQN